MSTTSVLSIKSTTITIPSNTWNRANTIAQFFRDALGAPVCVLGITLVENASSDQQLVSYTYNGRQNNPYDIVAVKYRVSSSSTSIFPWADYAYALTVVEGTQYNVTYIA